MHEHSWGKLALLADPWGPGFCLLASACCNSRANFGPWPWRGRDGVGCGV